ncbi:hypothetical protein [Thomasclavelia cocleata]|uniref:hypothetical protein n=1 Tax=Thomasclavelia cocleata TaxID=69824 RepID=UPI00257646AE|nr:hypothetical protein [Thomasclavelia cocleata]
MRKKLKMGKNEIKETERKKIIKFTINMLDVIDDNSLIDIYKIIVKNLFGVENYNYLSEFEKGFILMILQNSKTN